MDQGRSSRSTPIEGLSLELVRMVLAALPDVASLRTAVLSCPLFYRAFLEVETSIAAQVLLNQIDLHVFPEAIAAFESSCLNIRNGGPKKTEAILDFLTQNFQQDSKVLGSWPLQKAISIARLHSHVAELARKFVTVALATPPLDQTDCIATSGEMCRVERAMYRFELYCNLFRESLELPFSSQRDQQRLFFANFAPWENEQLGCIHAFLARIVSPSFNNIAEHDIAWGAFHVDYTASIDSPFIQHILSMGLEKLCQISQAETYEERYGLLYSPNGPPAARYFLHEGLEASNERNHDVFLDDLAPEDEEIRIKQPYYDDPDSGPRDVWRWAHQDESWANWVYQENRAHLRQWGYVMWNRSRLDAVGIFQQSWEDVGPTRDSLLEEQEAMRQQAYMENSWEKREEIYRRGGKGWWSWGDESKVRWRGAVVSGQEPSVPAHNKPDSLQEAREVLSMMKLPP